MADEKEMELISVLNEQDRILDSMLDHQRRIYNCVVSKSWDGLESCVQHVNELGNDFAKVDSFREKIAPVSNSIYFAPSVRDVFLRVKTKLARSKVESQSLGKYVGAAKEFIETVMDECTSQQHSSVYTSTGSMKKNYGQSIVINSVC